MGARRMDADSWLAPASEYTGQRDVASLLQNR